VSGIPTQLRDLPNRAPTTAVRPWDWALPPRPVDLETISSVPAGWEQAPRSERRPPVLFVHGASGAAWNFAEHWLSSAVRRGYPAHAVSLRGHGGSAGRERLPRTTLRDYVADVLWTAAALPEPPVLIGHGMGSLIVQQVLQRYPARAGVLVAPTPMFGVTGLVWDQVRRSPRTSVTALVTGRPPVRSDLLFCGLDSATGEAYLRRMGREAPLVLLQLGMSHAIGPVYGPVAVVGCREDAIIRPTDVRHTADMYGVRPIWLPGAGHLVMLDSSHSVGLDIVLDWVDEHVGGAARSLGPDALLR
jgi:pimeloyl-ACP methyl ester carboxylesterase